MTRPETTNRLVFIKYLYTIAHTQANQPEPLNAAAILTLHDTVELFLHLAAEQQEKTTDQGFLGYWKTVQDQRGNPPTQYLAMDRLNRARNNLKHAGIRPASDDIQNLTLATTLFLTENTPLLFSTAFDEIGLHQLLNHPHAREHVETATKAQANHQPIEVIINLAWALNWLIDDYRDAQRPQPLPQRTRFVLDNRYTDVQRELEQEHRQYLAAYLKHVNQLIADVHETHTILSLGINYPDYQRFRSLTPSVTRTTSDDPKRRYRVDIPIDFATYPYTVEELSFLTTFVITTGLALARTARHHESSTEL